ncbi:unnamed protein product, partial [marine sediment metagenome]
METVSVEKYELVKEFEKPPKDTRFVVSLLIPGIIIFALAILEAYTPLLGLKPINKLKEKAQKFKGKTVLNVNATKYGGGVAEILQNMIPLMNELGIESSWKVFTAPDSFFDISKKMHNALQGNMEIHFTDKEINEYIEQAKSIYDQIHPDSDFNIIHDPQPCPIINFAEDKKGKWIWRCHIDTAIFNLGDILLFVIVILLVVLGIIISLALIRRRISASLKKI